ncbi:MAG: HEAT repeat domain-containing protein [Janthinobacterium lividum]
MTAASPLTFDPAALDPEAAALLPRLSDADPVVRRIALLELADLEDENALPRIVEALQSDASPEVRAEAARVLASWEHGPVVEALCGALIDADAQVRAAAAQSLSELKEPVSGPALLHWVEHPQPAVQVAVLRGLRELRFPAAFEPALRALAHARADVRLEAVSVLGWLKDERALASLAHLSAHDDDAGVRRAAVGALGMSTTTTLASTAEALLLALRDTAWQVREEAAATLGKLRLGHAREALVAALHDDYWQVRLQSARALGKLRDVGGAAPLVALLSHSISNLRKEAALALGEIGDPASSPALLAAQADADPEVRKAVRIALQQIESRQA